MMYPKVTAIILNWNNAPDTLACLKSLAESDYPNLEPLVVDNGSSDGSASEIAGAYPHVSMLHLTRNHGFAGGNNAGIRQALDWGADYILILNNDTLVAPDTVTRLVNAAEADPQVGIAGPQMLCTDPPETLFAAGSFIHWESGDLEHRGMFEPLDSYAALQDPEPVDFIIGCGVLARREFIESAGGFNPLYFLNFEDVEWGLRAWQNGYKVLYVPQAVLWHKISATLGLASPANTYYMTRNALLFFWRNAQGRVRWRALSRILFRTLRTVMAWSVRPRYRTSDFRRKRAANLFALRDFIFNRFGGMGNDVTQACYGERL